MTWLNWSLKLHSRLRTISHLILTQNTQDFCSMNAYFICVIVHVQMWCVYSIACRSNPKKFLSILYFFLKCFYAFVFLSFCSNYIFHVFHQKLLWRHFREKLATKLFPQKWVKAKYWKHKILDRDFRDCLAIVSRVKSTHEKFCALEAFFASNFARR